MRVGFVGAGGIARAHINNLKQLEGVRIVGVTDPDQERARAVAAEVGGIAYTDVHSILDQAALDAIYICVPPFAHGEPEMAAIARRIPMYVEKPLGLDVELPRRIAHEVDRSGLITAVGFQLRYVDTAERLRTMLQGRTVGMITGHYACPFVTTPWWRKRALSGGQLVEQVIHIVDLIRYITGDEYETVYSQERLRIKRDVPEIDIGDVTVTNVTMASGAIGSISNTCALPSGWRLGIEIVAEDLFARWNLDELHLIEPSGESRMPAESGDPMALADRAFIEAVRSGDPSKVKCDYLDALGTQKAVMAAVQSASTGQPVRIHRSA